MIKNLTSAALALTATLSLTSCSSDSAKSSILTATTSSSSNSLQVAPGKIEFVDSPTLTEIDLGALPGYGTAATFTGVNIKNSGGLPLTTLSAQLILPAGGSSYFSIFNQCAAPLTPGTACNIILKVAPSDTNSIHYFETHTPLRVTYGDSLGHTGFLDISLKAHYGLQPTNTTFTPAPAATAHIPGVQYAP